MSKTKVLPKKEELADDEKIIEPDLVVPALLDEDAGDEDADGDDEAVLDMDPFEDKYEE